MFLSFLRSVEKPSTALSGVRSSWLMFDRKTVFALLAASACSRASFSLSLARRMASVIVEIKIQFTKKTPMPSQSPKSLMKGFGTIHCHPPVTTRHAMVVPRSPDFECPERPQPERGGRNDNKHRDDERMSCNADNL